MFEPEESGVSSHDQMKIDFDDEADSDADAVENDFDHLDDDTTDETSLNVQWIKAKQLDVNLPIFDEQFRMKEDNQSLINPTPFYFFQCIFDKPNCR